MKRYKNYNKKYRVVGATPDYWVSPVDFVPYVGQVKKGSKIYKQRKRVARSVKYTYRAGKRVVGKGNRRSPSPKSRTRRKTGTRPYYYYRGKRIYVNNKYGKRRK